MRIQKQSDQHDGHNNQPTTTVFSNATRPPSLEKNQFVQCESTAQSLNIRGHTWLSSCEWVRFHVARTVARPLLSRVLSRGVVVVLRGELVECSVVQNFFAVLLVFFLFVSSSNVSLVSFFLRNWKNRGASSMSLSMTMIG